MQRDVHLAKNGIKLRPYNLTDIQPAYKAARESIAEMSPWMPWCHVNYCIEESKAWVESCPGFWEKGTAYEFAILDARNGSFLGGCGLNQIRVSDRVANLGYWVRTHQTRQGVATTAALLLARFGFQQLQLKRIEIIVAVENTASQRVAEKIGAIREGVLRNRLTLQGQVHDAVLYSLVPDDLVESD
jgi:ribosomal-protein-serine acetyltransferase